MKSFMYRDVLINDNKSRQSDSWASSYLNIYIIYSYVQNMKHIRVVIKFVLIQLFQLQLLELRTENYKVTDHCKRQERGLWISSYIFLTKTLNTITIILLVSRLFFRIK